jgi:hypothetical protein
MGLLETDFLKTQNLKPIVIKRFIDDYFMLWTHGEPTLLKFLDSLNNFSPLKFTFTHSLAKVTFLDVDVSLNNGFIQTAVHIKETNSMQYLHFNSCHPARCIRSIPYSLAVRAKRISNNPESEQQYLNLLQTKLEQRQYPQQLVKNQINRAAHYTPKPLTQQHQTPLVVTYHPKLDTILHNTLKMAHPIIASTPSLLKLVPKPSTIAFRQPPNLKKLLSNKNPLPKPPKIPNGCFPCNNAGKLNKR